MSAPTPRHATYEDLFQLPDHVIGEIVDVVPNLAGWCAERMPNRPAEPYITVAPDWICEILSPSTARFDRVEKMPIYAGNGVPHLWLIDPVAHTLEAYALEYNRWILLGAHGGDQVVRVIPFDAVGINLQQLWR